MAALWLASSAPAAAQTSPPPAPPAATGAADGSTAARDEPAPAFGHLLTGLQLAGTVAPGKPGPGLGASALSWAEIFDGTDEKNGHLEALVSLGGGSAGFEGALEGKMLLGPLFRLGAHEALAARVGVHGWMWGNNLLYSSLLSLPEGELALHLTRGRSLFEAGVHGGAVLVGRYRPGVEASRPLGRSAEYGAHASLVTAHLQISLDFTRIDPLTRTPAEKPVDTLRGMLCLLPLPVALCLRGDWLRGSIPAATPHVHDSFHAGILIALPLLEPRTSGEPTR